jgi:hypothetical protein
MQKGSDKLERARTCVTDFAVAVHEMVAHVTDGVRAARIRLTREFRFAIRTRSVFWTLTTAIYHFFIT